MKLQKNSTLNVLIEDLSPEGHGVAKKDGFVIFVPGALPGEQWQVKLIKITAHYAVARTEKRNGKPSDHRIQPPCPLAAACGGCQIQHMEYASQLTMKEKMVKDCFARIGGMEDANILPIVGMEEPWRYRNKGLFPFGQAADGPCVGLYASHSHRVVPAKDCLIQSGEAISVMQQTLLWAKEKSISIYDEERHTGVLRHVMGRSTTLGETMAVIVTCTPDLPHTKALVDRLRQHVPGLVSVYHNINSQRTNVALGKENRLLWGKATVEERLGPVHFELSPQSFFQVNPLQTVKLYDLAAEAAGLKDGEILYDAYCGVGTIGQYIAHGKNVTLYGVEVVEQAVADARENAVRNGIGTAHYEAGAAEELFPKWKAEGVRPDVIVVDPPRKGCHPDFLRAVCEVSPERVVYVSCNPATLARDAAILCEGGYTLVWARPVDMFPHTTGVETVACFNRKNEEKQTAFQ